MTLAAACAWVSRSTTGPELANSLLHQTMSYLAALLLLPADDGTADPAALAEPIALISPFIGPSGRKTRAAQVAPPGTQLLITGSATATARSLATSWLGPEQPYLLAGELILPSCWRFPTRSQHLECELRADVRLVDVLCRFDTTEVKRFCTAPSVAWVVLICCRARVDLVDRRFANPSTTAG